MTGGIYPIDGGALLQGPSLPPSTSRQGPYAAYSVSPTKAAQRSA